MSNEAYLRYPHVQGDQLVFVAENDLWLVSTSGGRAHRLTADGVPVRTPRLSPDGRHVAWAAVRGGATEIWVAPTDGGAARQLTFWGQRLASVSGWLNEHEIVATGNPGQPLFAAHYAHAVPIDGSPSRRMPYGWASTVAFGPEQGALLSTFFWTEPARWKHYRGGTAHQLWLDREGTGEFSRVFADLTSSLADPVWVTGADGIQRIAFLSDHEGTGQVYAADLSTDLATDRLTRRTDTALYARHLASDGRQVVFASGGDLYLLSSLDEGVEAQRLPITLGGPRTLTRPIRVEVTDRLGSLAPDETGRATAIESRGTISWVSHRDGPARLLATGSSVRRRLPVAIADRFVAWVSDADGDDRVELVALDDPDAAPAVLVAAGQIGRAAELAASPDGTLLAIASHGGRLRTVALADGALTEVDGILGDIFGLAFSPDSRWLAYSATGEGPYEEPGPLPLSQIKLADLTGGTVHPVTTLRFTDRSPAFTRDGRHLAFLSTRSFDPSYDVYSFDLNFSGGCRPYLVPLAADTPSPFDPIVGGRPMVPPEAEQQARDAAADREGDHTASEVPATRVDLEGLEQRVTAVPVEAGRYRDLVATRHGLAWLRPPISGELGDDRASLDGPPPPARIEHYDLRTRKLVTVRDQAERFAVTGDGAYLVLVSDGDLIVAPSDRAHDANADHDDEVTVDLSRVRHEVEPLAEWQQMYHEAWRLMRDFFWRADMGGIDWDAVRSRYAALLPRLGSHDDLVDLIWEMQGELGSSHAYCSPPAGAPDALRRQGLLGADLALDESGEWRIERIVPGESSDRRARSPLQAPGVAAKVGEQVVSVDGIRLSATASPVSLLVGTAGKPVELTLRGLDAVTRRVVVTPLADEMPLRYHDWVAGRRAYVHERTGGTVGYVHIPDMMSVGWAQFHRDLRTEFARDAVVVDVRSNGGGHVSQLVVEKLARRVIGWDLVRGYGAEPYPSDARRGPMVALADSYAGSDGDIVTAAIQTLGLGPVVGTRTWGGVIGIDGRFDLVDGTSVTQPRFSFWFEKFGWGVENHGVDPDIEVPVSPQERVSGADPQLDRALAEIAVLLERHPTKRPPGLPTLDTEGINGR